MPFTVVLAMTATLSAHRKDEVISSLPAGAYAHHSMPVLRDNHKHEVVLGLSMSPEDVIARELPHLR